MTTGSTDSKSDTSSGVAYQDPHSKFSFPKRIDDFHFLGMQQYDREGKDISVSYKSRTPIEATIYVYPAAKNVSILPAPAMQDVGQGLIQREFDLRKREISAAHTDARLISEGWYQIVQGDHRFQGRKAAYLLGYNFGLSRQECYSELYVFLIEPGVMFLVNDRQYVEYRFTYPTNTVMAASREIGSFLSELAWPVK